MLFRVRQSTGMSCEGLVLSPPSLVDLGHCGVRVRDSCSFLKETQGYVVVEGCTIFSVRFYAPSVPSPFARVRRVDRHTPLQGRESTDLSMAWHRTHITVYF